MALNKDILGTALYNFRSGFNDKTIEEIELTFGNIETARLELAKGEAEIIIDHFKNNAEGEYQAGTLIAGANAVTRVGTTANIKLK